MQNFWLHDWKSGICYILPAGYPSIENTALALHIFLPFHNLILCAIAQIYLDFLMKLGEITTPQSGACLLTVQLKV